MDNREFIQVLADLKFISSVKNGDVMYIADRVVVPRSIFTTLYRKYMCENENGKNTAEFYASTLNRAYGLINKYKKMEGSNKFVDHLISQIKEVRVAVDENKKTYKKYPYIDACFDAIKIDIDRALELYSV